MKKPQIYADFQKVDDDGFLLLVCAGTRRDIEVSGLVLRDGLEVVFYSDDINDLGEVDSLLVDGLIRRSRDGATWVGIIDANGFRHESEGLRRC